MPQNGHNGRRTASMHAEDGDDRHLTVSLFVEKRFSFGVRVFPVVVNVQ